MKELKPSRESYKTDLCKAFEEGWYKAQEWEVTEAARMEIAVKAMQGILAIPDPEFSPAIIAEDAFSMADAMIKQAEQPYGLKLSDKLRAIKDTLEKNTASYGFESVVTQIINAIIAEDKATLATLAK